MGILGSGADAVKLAIEVALTDRATVLRLTGTVDPQTGGRTEAASTYAQNIPCRVDRSGLSPRERAIAEMRGSVTTFNLLLSAHPSRWPGGTVSVQSGDRIVITGEGAGTFEPAESSGPVTDQLVVELTCVKVT